tara:strand:- start:209 stop:1648 length:1440 start_codon:yes stop_codon:yes gene_type:complete
MLNLKMGDTILFEAIGDERKFMMPMLELIKKNDGVKIIGLVRFAQDVVPLMKTGNFEAVYSVSEMLELRSTEDKNLWVKAQEIEDRYETIMHYNLADRRLYFTGCTTFPYTRVETNQDYEEWISQFVAIYEGVEKIFMQHQITFALNGRRVVCDIAKSLNIITRCLGYSFLHDRLIWRDGMKVNVNWLKEQHNQVKKEGRSHSSEILQPPPFHLQIRNNFKSGIKLSSLIKTAIIIVIRTIYWHLRRYDKVTKFGYSPWRHIKFNFKRRSIYKMLSRNGVKLDTLIESKRPYVFLALQMEPEVLLSAQTPEFFDQISIIQQVSKELPVGTYLAVKDHVPALGYRDQSFYRMMDTMPNVILIDPSEFGLPIIKNARAVVSLLGRSAFEAASFGIPVLAFSPSLFFGYLPHVIVSTNFSDVKKNLRTLLSFGKEDRRGFAQEGEFMLAAMHDLTVDPDDYSNMESLGKALFESLSNTLKKI